jgi:site-specific DNA recombinase
MAPLLEGIYEGWAESYSRRLSKEIKEGHRERALQGYHHTIAPFGYRKDKESGILVPDEKESAGVLLAYNLYITGENACVSVAETLNAHGYRSRTWRSPTGLAPFSKNSAEGILKNPFYAGYISYKGHLSNGKHQPIIPRDLYWRVQEVRKSRTNRTRTTSWKFRTYLCSWILKCLNCGAPLGAQTVRAGPRYFFKCPEFQRGCFNKHHVVRCEVIDAQVAYWLLHLMDYLGDLEKRAQFVDEPLPAKDSAHELDEKLKRIGRLYRDLQISDEEYERERTRLLQEQEAIRNKKAPASKQAVLNLLKDVKALWDKATQQEKRAWIQMVFREI